MASPTALTWSSLLAHYSAGAWQPLGELARTYYARQGQLLPAAAYLALAPSDAAAPFIGSAAARQLVAAALPPAADAPAPTFADYAARAAADAQPLLLALGTALAAQGLTPTDLEDRVAAQGAADALADLLTPAAWATLAGAWQQQAQHQRDADGRAAAFQAAEPLPGTAYPRLLAAYPTAALETLAALPANELARALWSPRPTAEELRSHPLLGLLRTAAQQALADNYPDDELTSRLLAHLDPALATSAQALLAPAAAGQAAFTTVAELAQAEPDSLAARLSELPANHPFVYALAADFQAAVQRFLLTQAPAEVPAAPAPLAVRGQLLGADGAPLAGFGLVLHQVLADPADSTDSTNPADFERPLGALTTDADGRFALRVPAARYLTAADEVAEAPARLRAAVYLPGADLTGEPARTLLLEPTPDLTLATDLVLVPPTPASASVADLVADLPEALRNILVDNNISSLADVRAAGGVQLLAAELTLADPETALAARRLDGLAQFEVVSANTDLHEQVVAAGFYSVAQLVATTTADELTQRLAGPDAPTELRDQAAAFYQQATLVQALSQTMGLLTGSAAPSGDGPAAARRAQAIATSNPDAAPSSQAHTFSRRAIAASDQAEASGNPDADQSAQLTELDGPTDNPDASAQRQLPGHTVVEGFDPAGADKTYYYDSSQQCDCPACRSAVSPTAYLAALLKYGTEYVRQDGNNLEASGLQNIFQQPFAELRVSCQSAQELVCQYRLAIEVIQAYRRAKSGAALSLAEAAPYIEAMLEALLQALGTSVAELRTTPAAELPALAARLAVPAATLTELRTTFSPAQLADTSRSLDDVEADLERCFGLASTARDPLSTGLVLAATHPNLELLRWTLQGVEWGVNTGPDGQLHLEVDSHFTTTPRSTITVYKAGLMPGEVDRSEDNVVARGFLNSLSTPGLGDGTGGLYRTAAVLYPQHGSGLSGSVVLQTSLTGGFPAALTTFTLAVVPALTAGQQQALLAGWLTQDAAALAPLDGQNPVRWQNQALLIDPDLLGPDDFSPLDPSQPDFGNVAYRLWRRRYAFVQTEIPAQLLPGKTLSSSTLGKFIDALNQRIISYSQLDGTAWNFLPWGPATGYSAVPGTQVLAGLHTALAGSPTPATAGLLARLGLSAEGVQRLYDLWQLSLSPTQPLGAAEVQEAADLVRQAVKHALAECWVTEEQANGPLTVSLDLFQPALHEPQVGTWEQLRPAEFGLAAAALPRIDPDEVTPLDLPDANAGSPTAGTSVGNIAAGLWRARQAELLAKRQAVLASGGAATTPAARAAALLAYAYRPTPATATTGLPGRAPYATFELVWAACLNTADAQHTPALTYVASTLGLRPAEAERLLALRALVATQPTDVLWQEMAALLTLGWKRAVAYRQDYVPEGGTTTGPSWLAQETQAFAGRPALDYLLGTRKHRLVKWRASAADRAAWTQALALAAQRPQLDPDQLVPGDFRQAGERSRTTYQPALAPADQPFLNPAYDLYAQRTAQVQQWEDQVRYGWPTNAPDQWTYVAALLRSTEEELRELYRQRTASVDVSAALRRLGLPGPGLELLFTQLEDPAATNRFDELIDLLVQVLRQRAYAGWARQEIALGLVPSPLYFRRPQPEATPLATRPWRSAGPARRQWQRTLSARFAQAEALTAARQQAVRSAEDQYLPLLRAALIEHRVAAAPTGFDSKADWLSSTYLLDFKTACCQHTTRVAQGIEVLQKLFGNLRGGLPSNGLTLASANTTFEADWQWLGSFERWRSLLFLYLYPQNVLLPALKPGQSAQFRRTVSAIRQAATTTPADAAGYMNDYQAYLADMSSLEVTTSLQTYLETNVVADFAAAGARQGISLQAGLAASRAAYVNICYLQSEGSTADAAASFTWQKLPGAKPIDRLVGMAAYRTAAGQRYAYLFVLLRGELLPAQGYTAAHYPLTLAMQRLNLATLAWDEDYTEVPLPGNDDVEPQHLRIAAADNELWAPVVTGLRNRREPLITEAPLSLPAVSGAASQTLTSLLYEQITNVDLFFCKLHVDGSRLGQYESQTVFMANDLRLLACARLDADNMYYLMANSIGGNGLNLKQIKTGFNYYATQLYQTYTVYLADFEIAGTSLTYSNGQRVAQVATVGKNASSGMANLVRNRLATLLLATPTSAQLAARPYYWFAPISNPVFHSSALGYYAGNGYSINGNTDYVHFRLDDPAYPSQNVSPVGLRLVTYRGVTDPTANAYYFGRSTYEFAFNTGLDLPGVGAPATAFGEPSSVTKTVLITMHDNPTTTGVLEATPEENSDVYNGTQKIVLLPARYTYLGPGARIPRSSAASGVSPSPVRVLSTVSNGVAQRRTSILDGTTERTLHQALPALPPLFSSLSTTDQATRRTALAAVHAATPLHQAGFVSTLVSEAYYALPVLLAQELLRTRNYELALHYFRLVYDYTQLAAPTATPDARRLVYPALATAGTPSYATVLNWLQNPNNPYTLAALRPSAHLEYVVMSVVRGLLAYADTEFTADTAESVPRARTLYELASRLLRQDVTQYAVPETATLLDPVDAAVAAPWLAEWLALKGVLASVNQRAVLDDLLHTAGPAGTGLLGLFAEAQAGRQAWEEVFNQAWVLVNGQLTALPYGYQTLGANQDMAQPLGTMGVPVPAVGTYRPYVPFVAANFCVPTNPVPFALALQAELSLFKIRSCRNIAGIQRELDPYAAATDNTTGLPALNGSGQLVRTTRLVVPATQYRYAYIVERARSLVALAQQTESALLSAFEKRDAEAYNQLKARQDIATSQATVQLQTLRVTQAEDGVDLAGLQLERSEISEKQYQEWLDGGLNEWEVTQLTAIVVSGAAKALAALAAGQDSFDAFTSGGGSVVAAIANAAAAVADATAQFSGLQASYERRENEWNYQHNLALKDIQINQQQIRIANDQVRISGQEKRISQLQLDHASAVLNFLTTKFTNAELYDWMSRVLESAYGYFLQQATATARLAEQQLAFERQQAPAGLVQPDYYSDPVDDAGVAGLTSQATTTSTSRQGLTGSVRLLQDLTRLDEYAFETNRRKLQLTKTISLAQTFPTEFVRFRDTGTLNFACQPEWFDQDFPGHYLRVLRRVRTSVIALVPPVEGIKARLSTAGTSHVTVDGAPFQTLALPRAPEAVALTAPLNATGLFELDAQSELLLPFEGLGVDVPWQFSMQPASNPSLDYAAVADVLITLDYSALESADYARQVVQQLGTERRQVVALSLRNRFADQWYDLHHADDLDPADQYRAVLTLTPDDLPRALRQATVSQVSLFVDTPLDEDPAAAGAFTDRSHLELGLGRGRGAGGTAFTNQYGLISTRTGTGTGPLYTGNAAALIPLLGTTPAGDWTLRIAPGRLRQRLAAGLVTDIYLILEVTGTAPAYVL